VINGAHLIIYSRDAEADRAFFKNVLKFAHVDDGGGWLIFKVPPAELGIHPSDENDLHEVFFMCDDLDAEMARLKKAGVPCTPVTTQPWGTLTQMTLPGGGKLGLYQPRHKRP
jgi:catechol 2,3-dioxygenase-like lactoylglutathione lyase family enzyme